MNNIRDHLCRVAAEITENSAAGFESKAQWEKARPVRFRQYLEMQGVEHLFAMQERPPLNVTVTGVIERDDVIIEKLHYEALPKLYVTGNLYRPRKLQGPAPAVLYVCGHSQKQRVHYQAHPRRWAQLGFVTLLIETIERGGLAGDHHGEYTKGAFHWYSRGYTPAGTELWTGVRALDLLQAREEVDGARLGITGISGGGAVSWWVAAADERIKVSAPVCGTGTVRAHLKERTWDGHCACIMFLNTYRRDLADCGALIAPRPLMVASADRDGIFSIASIRETYERVKRIYELYGAGGACQLVATPGPHSYHEISRTRIFSFFMKHLMDKDVPPESVGDIGELLETEETLNVWVNGIPADEQTSTIDETFVPLAEAPAVKSKKDVATRRKALVAALRDKTFGHFPQTRCPLDMETQIEWRGGETTWARIGFTSEPDWRLHGVLRRPDVTLDKPSPALLFLWSFLLRPREDRTEFGYFTDGFDNSRVCLGVQCRGIADTSWHPSLQWHIRRSAAITGRTIASMQVYDALRALELVRSLPNVDGKRVALAAKGQMAAVAIYAALLDGNVATIILETPPATQNAASSPDGTGEAIEMLNCLRFTDLPFAAGLLFPADLVFIGPRPETYRWTEDLYRRLGGRVFHVNRLAEFVPPEE
ncbi:MAG: acetylxylan esterase [Kiritimatiellae bacterium]|nr:acetylxylan esterase [Kiritimatiellia bacterium]